MEVTLIDVMGDDLRVANAARVSFHKESEWGHDLSEDAGYGKITDYPKILKESDQKLISYLAKHNHWTPFSHVMITMREKVPIFVARQRFKHMVGFTYNEVSRRYVDDPPEFYTPSIWRKRAENKKQGSSDEEVTHVDYGWEADEIVSPQDYYDLFLHKARAIYEDMIKAGVAPEQARMVLPQSMYTEYFVTGSLAAWARMINQRKDPHAQQEIQSLARMCDMIIRGQPELKYSWEALVGEKWYWKDA